MEVSKKNADAGDYVCLSKHDERQGERERRKKMLCVRASLDPLCRFHIVSCITETGARSHMDIELLLNC